VAVNATPPSTDIDRPPIATSGALGWARANLFNNWYNAVLTVLALLAILYLAPRLVEWIRTANWRVVTQNLQVLLLGSYPDQEVWRPAVAMATLPFVLGVAWGIWPNFVRFLGLALAVVATAIGVLPVEFASLGLGFRVYLLLQPVLLFLGYVVATRTPLGQGRWAMSLWLGSFIATLILLRGTPLLALLFITQVLLPLLLPDAINPDRLTRGSIALILNNSAYMAENIRGGLQSVPSGQIEAAKALGLRGYRITTFIVLPQALRNVLPAIAGQFIILFKDTAVISLLGLLDFLGTATSIMGGARREFWNTELEMFAFVALVYWAFCYAMSKVSQKMEIAMGVGER
jgi:general L-amino acid transport system permease protein